MTNKKKVTRIAKKQTIRRLPTMEKKPTKKEKLKKATTLLRRENREFYQELAGSDGRLKAEYFLNF